MLIEGMLRTQFQLVLENLKRQIVLREMKNHKQKTMSIEDVIKIFQTEKMGINAI